jgi:hypothetical protein
MMEVALRKQGNSSRGRGSRRSDQEELLRIETCGGAEQRVDAGGVHQVLLADAAGRLWEVNFEEGDLRRGTRDAGERRLQEVKGGIA